MAVVVVARRVAVAVLPPMGSSRPASPVPADAVVTELHGHRRIAPPTAIRRTATAAIPSVTIAELIRRHPLHHHITTAIPIITATASASVARRIVHGHVAVHRILIMAVMTTINTMRPPRHHRHGQVNDNNDTMVSDATLGVGVITLMPKVMRSPRRGVGRQSQWDAVVVVAVR